MTTRRMSPIARAYWALVLASRTLRSAWRWRPTWMGGAW